MGYVIVGNGMAGVTAAQGIRRLDPDASVIIVTDERAPFYSRPGLMYHMMGYLKEWDLLIAREGFYERTGIELKYGTAARVIRGENSLLTDSGDRIGFGRLLLATGSTSRRLDVPGADLDGIHFMYSLTDAKRIMDVTRKGMRAVVIGGGLLGAELAEVWRHAGLHVTFLVQEPWYFKKALSEPQGRIVEAAIRRHGCDLRLSEESAEFRGDGRVLEVVTKSGDRFDADIVGVTIGVSPNVDVARESGIEVGRGILVDDLLATSRDDVFAAGDCAEIRPKAGERTYIEQLWYSADKQGQAVARNMCGERRRYEPGVFYNSAMFFDVDYVSIGAGRSEGDGQDDETVVSRNGRTARRFVHQNGIVTGITSVGANDKPGLLIDMVVCGTNLREAERQLGGRGWTG